VYFSPLTLESVEEVIQKERPHALMLAFGGQTALNLGVELYEKGILKKHGVHIFGTSVESIMYAEDRKLFNDKLAEIGVKVARSKACTEVEESVQAARDIGYPVMVRVAYALGGLGSGFCQDDEEVRVRVRKALASAPQVLVEESIKGWKEAEYEVVRDQYDNTITVCNMENFDPMGIHTGESIVVAPSQTFNDVDYHWLREIAIKVVRHLGIVGECNIQYAFHPDTLDYRVIEVNPRLSRSSALASKATGYPLAAVSAKLAQGIPLPVLRNSVTKDTSANFEPSLDYVVVKAPRWDVRKFDKVDPRIGSSMKSIGEVMAVARNFEEAFQKAIRMVDTANPGFVSHGWENKSDDEIQLELNFHTDQRVVAIRGAFKKGYTVDQLYELTRIDRWFLYKLRNIHNLESQLAIYKGRGKDIPSDLMKQAKEYGYADKHIGDIVGLKELEVRSHRKTLGIIPVMKHIDTMAAEFPARTNYLYTTYHGSTNDVPIKNRRQGVVVLGSGVYRIGSSIEFDYGAVSCARALRNMGKETIMVNFNPETVSTDYDESDKLYFEEVSLERVLDICDHENPEGVVVSVGGQLPQNIALKLKQAGVPIMGTDPDNIDRAEDRYKFSKMLDDIGVDQPEWKELTSMSDAFTFAEKVSYPVLVRPSYVLSGAAMAVVYNNADLEDLLRKAADVSPDHPVVMTKFLLGAEEVEIDAVCQHGTLINLAISQHVEQAGIHSGDATLVFPTPKLSQKEKERFRDVSEKITKALNVSGPVNIQYLYKDNEIKVIECNLRASRSLPFVSKVLGIDFVENIAKVFLGQLLAPDERCRREVPFFGVKSPTFSWLRLLGADPRLGVEMRSTGEVACFGRTVDNAFLKSVLSSYFNWPSRKRLLVVNISEDFARELRVLKGHGYLVWTAPDSEEICRKHGILHKTVPMEELREFIASREIDFVVNFPQLPSQEAPIYYQIRRTTADYALPLLTNERVATLLVQALSNHKGVADLDIQPHDYYHSLY
jgi:carbamoyl-phosphate synthase large subunit